MLLGILKIFPCLNCIFLSKLYFFLKNIRQLSKATLPSVTITFNFLRLRISLLKCSEQLFSSLVNGLSPGGTHFKMLVIYAE